MGHAVGRRWPRKARIGALAFVALVAGTACGSRQSREEVIGALLPASVAEQGASAPADSESLGAAPGDEAAPAAAGTAAPDAPVAGASGPGPAGASAPAGSTVSTVAAGASGGRRAGPGGSSGGQAPTGGAPKAGAPRPGPSNPSQPAAPAAPSAATASPVVLGHIGEYSGVVGSSLATGLPAVGAWTRWVNDNGGLNGHPVRLVTGDSGSDPAKAFALAKNMVERDKVLAFVGNVTPISGGGYADYVSGKSIPVIGGDLLIDSLWRGNPMFFPEGATLETQAIGGLQIAAQLGKPKVGILYCQEASACQQMAGDFKKPENQKKGGAQVVYEAQISLAQPDYTAECLQAQQKGAQSLVLLMDSNSQTRVARSCSQQSFKPQYISASIAVTDAARTDPNLDGFAAPQGVFPWPASDTPATRTFQDAMRRYAPGSVTGGSGTQVWTSGMLLRAASKALPATPTTRDILNGLYSLKNETLDGLTIPLTFVEGSRPQTQECYSVVTVKGGKWLAPEGSKFRCL